MYFQIENTPEHIRKERRTKNVKTESPPEESPRLVLAPFSRPPQVIFEDVLIGNSCERILEVFNPSKQSQQITLDKALPPGLVIHLPGEWLEVEPETCYCLTMVWTPTQPTAIKETLRFTTENRGRYSVTIVLKAVVHIQGKKQPKGFKTSPGKMKKKKVSKKSPVAIYKKKAEIIRNTTKVKTVNTVQTTEHRVYETFNKENFSSKDQSINSCVDIKCPFDSLSSSDLYFDTNEMFNKPSKTNMLHEKYDMKNNDTVDIVPQNVLKLSNKQNTSTSEVFNLSNLTFTPLKSVPAKNDKLDMGPRVVVSVNSDSELEDSMEMNTCNKENQTHSIIITSTQPPNKWLTVNQEERETTTLLYKKHPNTSSPKELNSPNFSINTDFSRISELSFLPQRFSTERKCFAKNDTQDLFDERVNSDTYTKESSYTPMEHYQNKIIEKPPHFFNRDQPKMCRQALFREYHHIQKESYDRNYVNQCENNVLQNNPGVDMRSPPRSITPPPLQSIPEESSGFSETRVLDKTNAQMATFTLDRTYDKDRERNSMSTSTKQTWSKKAIRVEPDVWKIPAAVKKPIKTNGTVKPKESIGSKLSNVTIESNKSFSQNITINTIGNVYSQSSTVDPFLSSTYFYDKEAVDKFEKEFKRWLNCILTPPADLDSNEDQNIDVGKAWIENRNKEVPLAPTREQVSSTYHNSHRLESLRRSARNLLMTPEMTQIFLKLDAQIEKKLIAIRNDRNLHLDVGLQKAIIEILLSYNPLWLRIGLEAIYGLIIPLKSNSDIEGLTLFIVQRMFKNPHLKNKRSKSSAPNMLRPAYIEAIKKYSLKKFFKLVYFLDQAKQKKLIPHDPCLFCRNAICKESREIIIRFTRELIAGIGDITKHLRPLGYVVCHKQSYLDEYKYAVHNLALDIRDGVRLSRVMEIILMKNGLLNQLRTPAISRLQKIHNVQVALNALKEVNFVIAGDIAAADIADGHREKTLSLLWQLIHVFRAPLFDKAANVIQTWWRKKFKVIAEKRKEEERERLKLANAASVIQFWWRRIQYNQQVEWKMREINRATIVVQKYCRMWLCRTLLKKYKTSVLKIEDWYRSVKLMREAKAILQIKKIENEQFRNKCASIIQAHVKSWLCRKHYVFTVKKVIKVQSLVRRFIKQTQYLQLKKVVIYVQRKFRSKLLMRVEMRTLATQKQSILKIQSYYRMIKQRRAYMNMKKSVQVFEERFIAVMKMRENRRNYLTVRRAVLTLQAIYRGKKCREEYLKKKNSIILLQRKIRAHQLMKQERSDFLMMKNAALILQKYVRTYLIMKHLRESYVAQRQSAILIQRYFRSYCLGKAQKLAYYKLRHAAIVVQRRYRSLLLMRNVRTSFLNVRAMTIYIQRRYRAIVEMRKQRNVYVKLRKAVLAVQQRYRANVKMNEERSRFLKIRNSAIKIQNVYRAYVIGKQQRINYLQQKEAVCKLQNWYRNCKKGKEVRQQYKKTKEACASIQRYYKAFIVSKHVRREYLRTRTATLTIQRFYRSYIEMKTIRQEFIKIRTSTVIIQKFYRSYMETKRQRATYLKMKSAVACIENTYRRYKEYRVTRQSYLRLKTVTINVQRLYRAIIAMRQQRNQYLKLKRTVVLIQQKYRALLAMRIERTSYMERRSAVLTIQTRFRAQRLMRRERLRYLLIRKACICIQRSYIASVVGRRQRQRFLAIKEATIVFQRRYRAILAMREDRTAYLAKRTAALTIQKRWRANNLMLKHRKDYINKIEACKKIQAVYRAWLVGTAQKIEYMKLKSAAIAIQRHYRMLMETRRVRKQYLQLRSSVITIQRNFRVNKLIVFIRRSIAAKKIQTWYRSVKTRDSCRTDYMRLRQKIIKVQSVIRMHIQRRKFLRIKSAVLKLEQSYFSYKIKMQEKRNYIKIRYSIIKLQSFVRSFITRRRFLTIRRAAITIQAAYRLKRQREQTKRLQEASAIVVQRYIRRYLVQSWYRKYLQKVLFVQRLYRGKLLMKSIRREYLHRRTTIIKLQSVAKGYLVRRQVTAQRTQLIEIKHRQRLNWAATKIQTIYRGYKVRSKISNKRNLELLQRWQEGALLSKQETIRERYESALNAFKNNDVVALLDAFKSTKFITDVYPMMYREKARGVVRRVLLYMSATNRSVPGVEMLSLGAAILVNLVRYRATGPKIYEREHVQMILTFMMRFSNSNSDLICKMATYLWLFSKYDGPRQDLEKFLQETDNHKTMVSIKNNVGRMRRMANNARNKYRGPSHYANASMNMSNSNNSVVMPALEPYYGIHKIAFFEDPMEAINAVFLTYNLSSSS